MGGDAFADPVGDLADDGPDGLFRVVRYEGEVEANELGVAFDQPECFHARADPGGNAVQFVVEDVAEALGEDEREDVVLVFGRVSGAADGARSVPDPGFQRSGFVMCAFSHGLIVRLVYPD